MDSNQPVEEIKVSAKAAESIAHAGKRMTAVTGIDNDELDIHLLAGDEVPAVLLKKSPWLVEDGHVVEQEPEPDGVING